MIFDLAVKEQQKGDLVALHGFCMGFQMLMRYSADSGNSILSKGFDASEHPNPLIWTTSADTSRLTGDVPVDKSVNHVNNPQYLRLRMSQMPPIVIGNSLLL